MKHKAVGSISCNRSYTEEPPGKKQEAHTRDVGTFEPIHFCPQKEASEVGGFLLVFFS